MSWLKTPAQQQERVRRHCEKQERDKLDSNKDKLDPPHDNLDTPPHLPTPLSSFSPNDTMADDLSPDAKAIVVNLQEELASMQQSQAEIKQLLALATAPPPPPAPACVPSPPCNSLKEEM
ncbi:hypothetical protein Pst134EA_030412 [Puccinia striiformis f. sp. tritici]|uniref:hypothetical protein n=1 Tax=Puccinia striiformis f. sp. tritici TaxID=168172 RepID=UPI0020075A01|nr:hypothetical protein Pst134EA_030412 [Puccinia striiformis f. sp. tritici]KAH9446495.1 hypothetical protein Pst134EA_030412 [Puccinia striiformis f. sp. tritici]KAI9600446.1 hypothetical protein H4Q26_000229 [Puccinia striiformis f. sp. tritici PST-130]